MDVLNVIYNCCDTLLLQQLMESRIQCQMSIPLILPDIRMRKSTFLLMSLKLILAKLKIGEFENKRVSSLDKQLKIIAFLRIGTLDKSKSKILNKLLDMKYRETFFHRDCEYGKARRLVSSGTVEAYWHFTKNLNDTGSYKNVFTVLNLRGDARQYAEVVKLLGAISQLVFLMVDLDYLESHEYLECFESDDYVPTKLVIFIVANTLNKCHNLSYNPKEFSKSFKNKNVQIFRVLKNWNKERLLSYREMSGKIRGVIDEYVNEYPSRTKTFGDIEQVFQENKFGTVEREVFEDELRKAKYDMEIIIDDINWIDQQNKLFPMQDHMGRWRKLVKLRKQQHRACSSPKTIEQHIASFEVKQSNTREQQFIKLQNNYLSKFVRDFCNNLINMKQTKTKCNFFFWIQTMMKKINTLNTEENNLAINFENEQAVSADVTEEHILDEKIQISLEHVFREFGQMFECAQHYLMQNGTISENQQKILNLPSVMAELMLNGVPLELMYVNEASIPIAWVMAVFKSVKEIIGDKKIFVISCLGLPNSCTSTLMNTMFGTKFCENLQRPADVSKTGNVCSIIPVDTRCVKMQVDYIMVIKSECLGNGIREDFTEMFSVVLALADLTIICINNPGEINAFHSLVNLMVQFKAVGRNFFDPSCLFVLPNESGIPPRVDPEQFSAMLDDIPLTYCENNSKSSPEYSDFKKFTDVFPNFDIFQHLIYLPNVFDKNFPMQSVNWEYSEQICNMKEFIMERLALTSNPMTMKRLMNRFSDIAQLALSGKELHSLFNNTEHKLILDIDGIASDFLWDFKKVYSKLLVVFKINLSCYPNTIYSSGENLRNNIEEELSLKYKSLIENFQISFQGNEKLGSRWPEHVWQELKTSFFQNCDAKMRHLLKWMSDIIQIRRYTRDTENNIDTNYQENIIATILSKTSSLKKHGVPSDESILIPLFQQRWPTWKKMSGLDEVPTSSCMISNVFEEELTLQFRDKRTRDYLRNKFKKDAHPLLVSRELNSIFPDNSDLLIAVAVLLLDANSDSSEDSEETVGLDIDEANEQYIRHKKRIQLYIRDSCETGFHRFHAKHIVSMLNEFYKKCCHVGKNSFQ